MPNPMRQNLTPRGKDWRAFVSILALSVSLATARPNITKANALQRNEGTPITLEPGYPLERELSANQMHSYLIKADAGQYIQFVIEQHPIPHGRMADIHSKKTNNILRSRELHGP